jgi:hypothetical protein
MELIIQGLISSIPSGVDLIKSILAFRTANPNMTQEQVNAVMLAMTQTIANMGADELATLALIPAVPPKA